MTGVDDTAQRSSGSNDDSSSAVRDDERPKICFLTRPRLVATEDGVAVELVLINRGGAQVGFRFNVRIDGMAFDFERPTLSLSGGGSTQTFNLAVPIDPSSAPSITVTVKSVTGETLTVGSSGVSVSATGPGGLKATVGTKGVSLGWSTVVVGTLVIGGVAGYSITELLERGPVLDDQESLAARPADVELAADDDDAGAAENESTARLVLPDTSTLFLIGGRDLGSDQDDDQLLLGVERLGSASPGVWSEIGAIEAANFAITASSAANPPAVDAVALPTLFDAEALVTGAGQIVAWSTVEIARYEEGVDVGTYCYRDEDRDGVQDSDEDEIGQFRTTGAPSAMTVALQLSYNGAGPPRIDLHVRFVDDVVYVPDEAADDGTVLEAGNCPASVEQVEYWSSDDQQSLEAVSAIFLEVPVDADDDRDEPIDGAGDGATVTDDGDESSVDGATVTDDGDESSVDEANGDEDVDDVASREPVLVDEPSTGVLALGDVGERVLDLERALEADGRLAEEAVDREFDALTKEAVALLQRDEDLVPDGVADRAVHEALGLGFRDADPADSSAWDGRYGPAPEAEVLRIGHRGERVIELQLLLVERGVLVDADVDGDFGPSTRDAVRRFQRDEGLEVDGSAGPATVDRLAG